MLESIISEKIKKYASDCGAGDLNFSFEIPSDPSFGDLSTNAAMILASQLKRNPVEIANEIKESLADEYLIESIEIKGPGFINIFMKKSYLVHTLCDIFEKKENYGSENLGNNKKIVLEHTNVNPNKALHIGHLRNACLGSSCENILEKMGYDVEAQYYVDDTGVQVAVTTLGMKRLNLTQNEGEKFDHFAQRVYVETMNRLENDTALQEEQKQITHDLDAQNGENAYLAKELATKVIYSNLVTMHDLRINYDVLIWENDIINEGFWSKAYSILRDNPRFKHDTDGKNAGCWVVEDILGEEKVIVKSNGVATYTGKDIAYHLWKFNKLFKDFRYKLWPDRLQEKELWSTSSDGQEMSKFGRADIVVNFIDVRQAFPQQAVKESLKALGFEKEAENLHHIGYGIVFLSPDTANELGLDTSDKKNRYAMSGRKGIGILADDLLDLARKKIKDSHPDSPAVDDVAIGAIKYQMLKYNTYSDLTFDLNQALDLYGNTGPYIQYAYARCKSVINKAGREISMNNSYDNLNQEEEEVIKQLSQYPTVIEEAGKTYSPNILCNYLYELARKYNTFYSAHSILNSSNEDEVNFRLLLTSTTAEIIKNGLTLLGIPTPEKM